MPRCSYVYQQDADKYHQSFSSDNIPTLHRVIPALESLCTKWEKKLKDPKYSVFHPALQAGLDKLNKYYAKLDNSDVYILALRKCVVVTSWYIAAYYYIVVLHPYYKLRYIEKKWGRVAEQDAQIAAGNPNAINWFEHAREVVDAAVSGRYLIQQKLTLKNNCRWSITGLCVSDEWLTHRLAARLRTPEQTAKQKPRGLSLVMRVLLLRLTATLKTSLTENAPSSSTANHQAGGSKNYVRISKTLPLLSQRTATRLNGGRYVVIHPICCSLFCLLTYCTEV